MQTVFKKGRLIEVCACAFACPSIPCVQERLKLLTGFMKDVNENRLSKFEFALGITKVVFFSACRSISDTAAKESASDNVFPFSHPFEYLSSAVALI